jgi:hypothetical protein
MAVTSEFTTGNLAPTVPSFEVMSVNSVRCAVSDETACRRAQHTASAQNLVRLSDTGRRERAPLALAR